jgi:hypothetical protein
MAMNWRNRTQPHALRISTLALLLGTCQSDQCPAQCQLATVAAYATGNPVTLRSSFPGQYMVPGSITLLEIGTEMALADHEDLFEHRARLLRLAEV